MEKHFNEGLPTLGQSEGAYLANISTHGIQAPLVDVCLSTVNVHMALLCKLISIWHSKFISYEIISLGKINRSVF